MPGVCFLYILCWAVCEDFFCLLQKANTLIRPYREVLAQREAKRERRASLKREVRRGRVPHFSNCIGSSTHIRVCCKHALSHTRKRTRASQSTHAVRMNALKRKRGSTQSGRRGCPRARTRPPSTCLWARVPARPWARAK